MFRIAIPLMAVILLAPAASFGQEYLLTELGSFPAANSGAGYEMTMPFSMNNLGEVVGVTCPGEGGMWGSCIGFIWSQCRQSWIVVDVQEGEEVYLTDINDLGQVIGYTDPGYSGFLYLPEPAYGLPAGLHRFSDIGHESCAPGAINNLGQIVCGSRLFHPAGGTVDMGSLGGGSTVSRAINDAGQVVGRSDTLAGNEHAFLWENGVMTDLGTLGGDSSQASDINSLGQVVGTAKTSDGVTLAVLWNDQVITELPELSGWTWPSATAINDSGQVLGCIYHSGYGRIVVLWDEDTIVNLSPHLAPESSAEDLVPADLNNAGQVVAWTGSSAIRGRLITPVHGDCNNNGIDDSFDIAAGTCDDYDHNWIPDECDIAMCHDADCNGDGIFDRLQSAGQPDCNDNNIADACDIAAQVSSDCDTNGVPDECEDLPDCNENNVPDVCEARYGTVIDCDQNGEPDICQRLPAFGGDYSADCDANEVLDVCQGEAFNRDCNENGRPDGCGIALGLVPDCNDNYWPDSCDVDSLTSCDYDANGVPDECQEWDACDFDHNGSVDLDDFAEFSDCFTAPCDTPPCQPFIYADPCCVVGDADSDGDVDLADFAVLQQSFDG